jgi:hypothetical protein
MSTRPPEAEEHVHVRGTMVSTFSKHPSKLSVRCVRDWGMPSKSGTVTVDNTILHVEYDKYDTDLIHVWARKPERLDHASKYSDDDAVCVVL